MTPRMSLSSGSLLRLTLLISMLGLISQVVRADLVVTLSPSTTSSIPTTPSTVTTFSTVTTASNTATSQTTSTTTSSTRIYTGIPRLHFNLVPTMTACGTGVISFGLDNEDPSKYQITLQILDVSVDQVIPPADSTSSSTSASTSTSAPTSTPASTNSAQPTTSTSSIALATNPSPTTTTPTPASTTPQSTSTSNALINLATFVAIPLVRRTTLHINQTFDPRPANAAYHLNVTFPQGRYYVIGSLNDAVGSKGQSAVFTVVEGNDTSCLAAYASASSSQTASATTSKKATSTADSSGAKTGGGSTSRGGNGLGGGPIAGIVIGVVVGLALLGLLAWCCLRRRRRARGDDGARPEMSQTRSGGRFGNRLAAFRGKGGKGHMQMPSEGTSRSQIIPRGFAPGEATLDNDTSAERFGGSPIALDQHTASSSRSGQDPFATGPSTPRTPYDYDTAEFGAGNSRRMSSQINSAPHGPSSWSEGNRRPGLGTYAPGRTSSLKRKPVPSLGPELRTEFGQQTSGTEVRRQSYQIFPDPPLNQGD